MYPLIHKFGQGFNINFCVWNLVAWKELYFSVKGYRYEMLKFVLWFKWCNHSKLMDFKLGESFKKNQIFDHILKGQDY